MLKSNVFSFWKRQAQDKRCTLAFKCFLQLSFTNCYYFPSFCAMWISYISSNIDQSYVFQTNRYKFSHRYLSGMLFIFVQIFSYQGNSVIVIAVQLIRIACYDIFVWENVLHLPRKANIVHVITKFILSKKYKNLWKQMTQRTLVISLLEWFRPGSEMLVYRLRHKYALNQLIVNVIWFLS